MEPNDLEKLRRDYIAGTLSKSAVDANPMIQFGSWLHTALEDQREVDANAMVLATCAANGQPSARVVLLKDVQEDGFTFYTNQHSRKGRELKTNPRCSATFWWSHLHRQVRIEGIVSIIPEEKAVRYFSSRPPGSQMGAIISDQSEVIPDRGFLEDKLDKLRSEVDAGKTLEKPAHWGGYLIKPHRIEFWQGRESRLHDRIRYEWKDGGWKIDRLSP